MWCQILMEAYSPNNKRIFSRLGKCLEGGQVSLGKKFFSCYRGHSVSNVSRRGGKNHANFKGYLSHRKSRAFLLISYIWNFQVAFETGTSRSLVLHIPLFPSTSLRPIWPLKDKKPLNMQCSSKVQA